MIQLWEKLRYNENIFMIQLWEKLRYKIIKYFIIHLWEKLRYNYEILHNYEKNYDTIMKRIKVMKRITIQSYEKDYYTFMIELWKELWKRIMIHL